MCRDKNLDRLNNSLSRLKTVKKQYEMFLPLKEMESKFLLDELVKEETFSSNHIEGNRYTLDETRYLIETRSPVSGRTLKEANEIQNIYKAIYFSLTTQEPITEKLVKKLHYISTINTLDNLEQCGEYKTERNWIGSITTSFPEHTPIHMNKLLSWLQIELNRARVDTDIIRIATEFKYRFLVIHPFIDGNGRVSRLLFNMLLARYGFIHTSILPEDKEGYYKALQNSSIKNNVCNCSELQYFMCNSLIKTYQRTIRKLEG